MKNITFYITQYKFFKYNFYFFQTYLIKATINIKLKKPNKIFMVLIIYFKKRNFCKYLFVTNFCLFIKVLAIFWQQQSIDWINHTQKSTSSLNHISMTFCTIGITLLYVHHQRSIDVSQHTFLQAVALAISCNKYNLRHDLFHTLIT